MADALTNDDIEKQLCGEFETLMSLPAGSVNADTDLPGLGVDSLRFVSLILAIEQRFGVNMMNVGLAPEDMLTPRTFAAAIKAGMNA